MLHDLEADGLERGQSEQELGEPLWGHRVHSLGACLQRLENLLLEDLNTFLGGRTQTLGICSGVWDIIVKYGIECKHHSIFSSRNAT